MRPALLAAALLSGCAFGAPKPGLTKEGAAVSVTAATPDDARRAAVAESLDLFVDPASPGAEKAAELARSGFADFTGAAKLKAGAAVVPVRFVKLAAALEKEGLLRPSGYSAKEPRVLLLVAEPAGILDLGVGPAADALRRSLSAYGLTAIDGRDSLNGLKESKWKYGTAEELVGAARRAGADWMLVAAATVSAESDPASGSWRGRASLVADAYQVTSSTPVEQVRADSSVLDMSSAAARGKALDEAGEDAAGKAAGLIQKSLGGRSEAAVFALGDTGLPRLRRLVASIRKVDGVAGAFLAAWKGEEGAAVIRVFLTGMKTDGLAARLLRREPTLTLLSVEPDDGRLAVEIPGRRTP